MTKNVKRLLPFIVLVALITLVYAVNLHTIFNLSWLRDEHLRMRGYVYAHPFISPLIYIGVYTLSVCLVLPDSTILTILGGLLFPLPMIVAYAAISEGIGSFIFYQIFSSVFRLPKLKIHRPILHKIQRELRGHPATYLLFLRVSHIIPFWTLNLIAAYFRVKPWTFIWTTSLGVIPLTYILAEAGQSLAKEITGNVNLTVADIFTIQVKIALLVIGTLIITPLIYKNFIRRRGKS